MTEVTTKDKILGVAHKLFAEKGFNGVGIREIASVADVNIAAINYHFNNKENLYQQTIKASTEIMAEATSKIYAKLEPKNTENLSIQLFEYFVKDIDNLKTAYKLFLDTERFPDMTHADDDIIGPPGGRFFFETLKEESSSSSEDDIIWAVRTIFTMVMQKALIAGNKCLTDKHARNKDPIETIKEDIARLVKIVIEELKTQKYPF
jgi:AcrR family transcriptional regulator